MPEAATTTSPPPATSPGIEPCHPNSNQDLSSSFRKSKTPSRILYYRNDGWVDFPCQVFDELTARFVAGRPVFDISISGKLYRFDFIRMVLIDLSRKVVENSIAWIDIDGRCFFPRKFVPKSVEEGVLTGPRFPGAQRLTVGEKNYEDVEKVLLSGIRRAGMNATVTAVHRCSFSGLSERLRVRAFQMVAEMTKAARGDANATFGWYGASAEGIAGVVKHGFGRTNAGMLGIEARGAGVHLSPPNSPFQSSRLAEADESGEKHIVLCRVVLGKSEKVDAGSAQCHPSSDEFDSGVDDLTDPRWYIIWSTHMNTHILPEYIVSFRTPSFQRQGMMQASVTSMINEQSFKKILSEIGRSLPSTSLQSLEMMYNEHKAGKANRDEVIRHLRSVVGDKLLFSAIRRVRGC